MPASEPLSSNRSTQGQFIQQLSRLPWWLLFILFGGVFLFYKISTDELYTTILSKLLQGVALTVFVAVVSYFVAIVIGLIAGLGRVSKNPIIFNIATLYVQIIRGVPILVQIFYVAFVLAPAIFTLLHNLGLSLVGLLGPDNFLATSSTQDLSMLARVMIALAIAYGGFEAETFRAGIESISKGQMEAARSLGMSYFHAMRYVIMPQAVRRVLPPLSNDFISMIKDSSLVSVLGVRDVTQEARLYAAASFRYPETYNTLAFVYLTMTILLSLGVKWLENRMGQEGRSG
ncbi:MAG TPA: amino acid ABC transporter permease [Anaerolineae bacterium]|nr:amino acid ABC transporter permease [Anaerolineae bacterium]